MDEAREPIIAVKMNDEPLPPIHGYPARLIVPGLYGYVSATKWLTELELTTLEAFDALLGPQGLVQGGPDPDPVAHRHPAGGVAAGRVAVAGVAWAPDRGISKVEVGIDGDVVRGGPVDPDLRRDLGPVGRLLGCAARTARAVGPGDRRRRRCSRSRSPRRRHPTAPVAGTRSGWTSPDPRRSPDAGSR